jgi:hypothetical protein
MDARILVTMVAGLALVALGGFYFALKQSTPQFDPPGAPTQAASLNDPAAAGSAVGPAGRPATPEAIEAEIARSEHAELQALLKRNFPEEYRELIAAAVRRRNEGLPDHMLGEDMFGRSQQMMSPKLKFAVGAGTAAIDKLAANEVELFEALSNEGSGHCLKVLGKDDTPSTIAMPANVRRLMQLGTLYRFEAIVDGMPELRATEPLTGREVSDFEASLNRDGLKFDEIRTGAFLSKEGEAAGKPCQMVAKLYRAIARLDEITRRKLYAGMFFLGRDK